ncbi:MAG: hypothetical protein IT240_01045 [Bacteroidia bacterium]|nr:hypothetical protein [Bacteroidia bacterium]
MIRKNTNFLSFFLVLSILFTGLQCQKFEEDTELVHLKSVKKRIAGYKVIEEDLMGSYDMQSTWRKSFGEFYFHFTTEPYRPDTTGYGYNMFIRSQATNETICKGEWGFKSSVSIYWRLDCFDAKKSRFYPNRLYSPQINIIRLSDKEMWMEGQAQDSLKNWVSRSIRLKELRK